MNPKIGTLAVSEITTEHVLGVLRPIWAKKPETASRVRGRIETILAVRIALGRCPGPNVARLHNHIQVLLPSRSRVAKGKHHAALEWADMPSFVKALRQQGGMGALALEFLIFTAARSGEDVGERSD